MLFPVRSLAILLGIAIAAGSAGRPAFADSCPVVQPHPFTPEEQAFASGNLPQAETLYRQKIAGQPRNAELIAGLVRTLIAAQKIDDAHATVTAALAAAPQSAPLLVALAEVQHRQGLPWDEEKSLQAAGKADICYPRLHLALAYYYRFNSYYASSLSEIKIAHQLDPYDGEIHRNWMQSLPIAQRIEELKRYLATKDLNIDSVRRAESELAILENRQERQGSACHLASPVASTEIPFAPIMLDAERVRAWGLEVAFNNQKSRLEIDTGASGLYIKRSLAEHAGLKAIAKSQSSGIGDKGVQTGYTAYADSIRIGGLEFKNCLVEVSDRNNVVDTDGLIGMDVFSSFLVTLDFPWRKLTLGPLPPYPGTAAAPATLNTEQQSPGESSEDSAAAPAQDGKTAAPAAGPHDRYIAPEMKGWDTVYRAGHNMIVPTVLNNKTRRLFIIDTGAFRTSISPAAAREVTKVGSDPNANVKGISGRVEKVYSGDRVVFRFAHLQQEIDGVPSFDVSGVSRNIGTEISGFLGADLLHYLVLKIDYRDGLMDFEYSQDRGYQHIR